MILIACISAITLLSILFLVIHLGLDKKIAYKDLKGKHVVITGGSSGIGKAAAAEAVRLGAHVTIIGRDVQKLSTATKELSALQSVDSKQKIQYSALDVTSDYQTIEKHLSSLETEVGPIFMLIACAGQCICGQFETMEPEQIKQMIDLNYFGTAYPTRYVLPGMKERNEGILVFVSTEAALIGIYGYSAYGAAKWAVRGLAESVLMELVGTNVRLTLAFPADTDTPGFANEELTKPKETKLISSSGGLQSPEEVGKKMIWDALNGKTYSVFGASGTMLSTLFCGSIESFQQVVLQVLFMGILRAITVGVLLSFHKIVRDGIKERKESEAFLLVCVVAVSQAGGILAPVGYGSAYHYGAAWNPYNSYPAQPAIASQHSNILRSPFNLGQVSTYSKAIDTPFSSVRKSDVRVSNPGVAVAPAYHGYAAPVVSHYGVAAPVVSHYGVGAPLAAPVAKVAAGGLLGVAFSAAPAVSHMTYTNGLGLAYSW